MSYFLTSTVKTTIQAINITTNSVFIALLTACLRRAFLTILWAVFIHIYKRKKAVLRITQPSNIRHDKYKHHPFFPNTPRK